MTENRTFIRQLLHAAHRARARGDRETAIRALRYAIAEGSGTSEENLQILLEEAGQRPHPRPHPTTTT